MTKAIQSVNAFVVKFANVNGSGSASSNELFAKSILRMGVPVSPRNIFPSNIQGLPTWYEVRVSESGWLGLGLGERALREIHPEDGRAGQPAQYLPLEHPGPAHLVRGARLGIGLARARPRRTSSSRNPS